MVAATQLEAFREYSLGEGQQVRVLVIEQDEDYAEIIQALLGRNNTTVEYVKNAQKALESLRSTTYDLIFLSANLNNLEQDGTLIETIRQSSIIPVIALNEQNDEENGAALVLDGADYDLQKPFTPRRLRAAVTAVLRRTEVGGLETSDPVLPDTIESGGLTLSLGRLEVTVKGKRQPLSAREFSLLQFLMSNPGRAFTREELAIRAWGWAENGENKNKKGNKKIQGEMRAIDSTIKRLRSKIEEDSRAPRYILTERNVGYRFVGETDENKD